MTERSSRAGSRLGRYRLDRLVGRGGMGEVYQAYDLETERVVAIKLLHEKFARNSEYQTRFLRESRTAARLNHPNVIPIHDFGEIDGMLYIDMRLVDGLDLRKILREGAVPPERAVGIIRQIAGALTAAHDDGLTHRDVKPDNILVDGDDFAYLVDFGIAHRSMDSHLTETGSAVGSVAYMAPERFDAVDTSGPPSDQYALACVLFEAVSGRRPFPAASAAAAIDAHLHAAPPLLGSPLDPVLQRALSKTPGDRFETTKAFGHAAVTALRQRPAARSGPAPAAVRPPAPPEPLPDTDRPRTSPDVDRVNVSDPWNRRSGPRLREFSRALIDGESAPPPEPPTDRRAAVPPGSAADARRTPPRRPQPGPPAPARSGRPPQPARRTSSGPHPASPQPASPRSANPQAASPQPPAPPSSSPPPRVDSTALMGSPLPPPQPPAASGSAADNGDGPGRTAVLISVLGIVVLLAAVVVGLWLGMS